MFSKGASRTGSMPAAYKGEVLDFELTPANKDSNKPVIRVVGFDTAQQKIAATNLASSAPTPLVCNGVEEQDEDDAKELEEWERSMREIQRKYPSPQISHSLRHNASSDSRADSKFKQLSSTRHPQSDAGRVSLINTPEVVGRTKAQRAHSHDIW